MLLLSVLLVLCSDVVDCSVVDVEAVVVVWFSCRCKLCLLFL